MKSDEVKQLRARILEMREQSANITLIADTLGCSRSVVYKALNQGTLDRRNSNSGRPLDYSEEVKDLVLDVRKKNQTLGPLQIFHLIHRHPEHYGFKQKDAIPSPTTIAKYIHLKGWANKPVGPRDTRLYPDSAPTEPGTITIDTWGPWHIRADKVYLATVQDRWTRATAAVPATSMRYRQSNAAPGFSAMTWAAAVAVAEKYLCPQVKIVYSDNGVGMIPAFGTLPASARYILSLGAKLIFIPPGQPWRNGRLERFHFSMEREYWNLERPPTVEEGLDGLTKYFNYFNYDRPHSAINFASPVNRHTVKKLPFRFWEKLKLPTEIKSQTGVIEAIRIVYNDGEVDLWGNSLYVSPLLAGQYVRVHFAVTGSQSDGLVFYQTSKGEDNIVAKFTHNLDVSTKESLIEDVQLTDYVIEPKKNQNLDEDQLAKQQSRILKRRSRLEKKRDR